MTLSGSMSDRVLTASRVRAPILTWESKWGRLFMHDNKLNRKLYAGRHDNGSLCSQE